jgi:Fe-S cluster biosynthesis and repair protein YggX
MSTSDLKKKGWKGKGYYPKGSRGLWVKTDDSGNIKSYIPL